MFRLLSDGMTDGGRLPLEQVLNGMGHSGGNLSPHLKWEGAPSGTKSFVVTVFDPDAPTESGWWHWILADIPASASAIPLGAGSGKASLPVGALQTRSDFGSTGYGGAAPPPGKAHRYVFKIRALSVEKLGVDAGASGAMVSALAGMHQLAEVSLTVTYP